MSGGIFLLNESGELVDMRQKPFKSEEYIQMLIEEHPELLAGDQFESAPRRFLLISREMGIPSEEGGSNRWAIDHLFIDQDAILTVVEVKRSSDTRIRREVVGQMLDYAANAVVYLPAHKLRAKFEKNSKNPEEQWRQVIGDGDYELFWEQADTNLRAGKIRLLFVADDIPLELRRIVEFLNKSMDNVEVLAVEVKQYTDSTEKVSTLVPRIIGKTAESQRNKSLAIGKLWDETSFFSELTKTNEELVDIARTLLSWANNNIKWNNGIRVGSFSVLLDDKSEFKLFHVRTDGTIELKLNDYKTIPPFGLETKHEELLERIQSIEGLVVDTTLQYPKIPMFSLMKKQNLLTFISTFNWFIQEIIAAK